MKRFSAALSVLITSVTFAPTQTTAASPAKQKAVASIEHQASEMTRRSDFRLVWNALLNWNDLPEPVANPPVIQSASAPASGAE